MPVVHEYTDGSSMYLRSTVEGTSVTLHLTAETVDLLSTLGYTDGSTVDWSVLKPLFEHDYVYTNDDEQTTLLQSVFEATDPLAQTDPSEYEKITSFVESDRSDSSDQPSDQPSTTSAAPRTNGGGLTTKYTTNTDFSTDPNPALTDQETDRFEGPIEFIDESYSYGFVTLSELDESVYLTPAVIDEGSLSTGERVSFGIDSMDGGLQAVDVQRVADSADEDSKSDESSPPDERPPATDSSKPPTESGTVTPYYDEPIVCCPFCDDHWSSLELLAHVRRESDADHGSDGAVPSSLDFSLVTVVASGTDTVVWPQTTTAVTPSAFTAHCRWCGDPFVRYDRLEAHCSPTDTADGGCDHEECTSEAAAVFVPLDGAGRSLAPEKNVENELSAEASTALTYVESDSADVENAMQPSDTVATASWSDERVPAMECYWLLSDLEIVGSSLSEALDADHNGLSATTAYATQLCDLLAECIETELFDAYRTAWERPAHGRRLDASLEPLIAVPDDRAPLFVPDGFELATEQMDELDSTDAPENDDPEAESVGDSGVNEDVELSRALASEIPSAVPRSVIDDVLETYATYEKDRRESSWFHAMTVLQRGVTAWETSESEGRP